jgi:hypothetical protein
MTITVQQHGEFIQINETRFRIRDLVNYSSIDNEGYGGKGRYILRVVYKYTGNEIYQMKVKTDSKEDLDNAIEAIDAIMHKTSQPNPQE